MVTVISLRRVEWALLRVLGVSACVAGLAAPLAAPVRADMRGNAFLMALSNAGITYPHPNSALALGQSVCPMLVTPGQSFDSVTAEMQQRSGLGYESAGLFTIVAVANYCPAVIAPLLQNRLTAY
ncbi:DUF732 domain-containing protein [Mycobacterium sp. SMC-2]|uniref:DUF732 domain-containing protein n=1 Tax=Mycobacterium sp. SMC-2 TaxID=2857058 RepID=UPI0021B329BA|nr:DUF732 domain-containing protein [Mycobacterium sp. SMC-2]